MKPHPLFLIVALDAQNGIGKNGKLPWKIKTDMKFFAQTTRHTIDPEKQNMVIMGRTTWESISEKFRPLTGRKNVVLTSLPDYNAEGATICHSLKEAMDQANQDDIENIFILGGGKVFQEVISYPNLTGIYLTKIHKTFDCDTYFPQIPAEFKNIEKLRAGEENGISYDFLLYKK